MSLQTKTLMQKHSNVNIGTHSSLTTSLMHNPIPHDDKVCSVEGSEVFLHMDHQDVTLKKKFTDVTLSLHFYLKFSSYLSCQDENVFEQNCKKLKFLTTRT